jgi:hypothetical protein
VLALSSTNCVDIHVKRGEEEDFALRRRDGGRVITYPPWGTFHVVARPRRDHQDRNCRGCLDMLYDNEVGEHSSFAKREVSWPRVDLSHVCSIPASVAAHRSKIYRSGHQPFTHIMHSETHPTMKRSCCFLFLE